MLLVLRSGDEGMHILIIDDDAILTRAIRRTLRDYPVTIVNDPIEAVTRYAGTDTIDLVLCDLTMPGMTGLEVFAAFRSAGFAAPFVLMSGHDPVRASLEAGVEVPAVDAVLAKPFSCTELCALVARLAHRRTRSLSVAS
jgi:CheY-like chemotaxis protein